MLNVGLGFDDRSTTVQAARVYRKSHDEFIKVVQRYPTLCKAAIGYSCCQAGGQAKAMLEAQNFTCPSSPYAGDDTNPFGMYQLASKAKDCAKFKDAAENGISACDDPKHKSELTCTASNHVWQQINLTFYDAEQTRLRLHGYLLESHSDIMCSVVEHRLTGFFRTGELFAIFATLFEAAPQVRVLAGCGVQALAPLTDGRVEVRAVAGCPTSAPQIYHKVVVAASVGSIPLLRKVDPHLDRHLVPIKGYGLAGVPNDVSPVVAMEQSGRAVHFIEHGHEQQAAYGRSRAHRRVKIWGGHEVDMSENGHYPMGWCDKKTERETFQKGPHIARELLKHETTTRRTGVRPIASVGQVPILKRQVPPCPLLRPLP
jgi:hypothetical protein